MIVVFPELRGLILNEMFTALTTDNRFALHSVAVCLLALLGTLMNVAAIDDYVIQVFIIIKMGSF